MVLETAAKPAADGPVMWMIQVQRAPLFQPFDRVR
jgi:hypothetical protein